MDVHSPFDIGTDFVGYRVEAVIGRGGMGIVYRASDLRLKRSVALKLVAPSLAHDDRFRERFARETELVMSLEHPNVVPVYDAGDVDGRLYLAMRLVDGTDLGSLLRSEGALAPARAVAICAQIASALDAAHDRGLVHRDVKPSNVLLDESGHVYLADFGLTRGLGDQVADDRDRRSLGTPAYLAPEQLDGLTVDGRADVYSLGCVLFECLTGERVFRRDSRLAEAWAHLEEEPPRASRTRRGLPEAVDSVLARAIAKEPSQRYERCGALIMDAEHALGLRSSTRFRSRTLLAAAAVLVAASVVAAVAVLRNGRGPAVPPRARDNTLVRIDPQTNVVKQVIEVGREPLAVASWGRTVWVYSRRGGVVSEVDEQSGRVLRATPVSLQPVPIFAAAGPVLAADRNGAWVVGVDRGGRGLLTLVPLGGGRRNYVIGGRPVAVATGLGAVWAFDLGLRSDRLVRLDPASGRVTVEATFSRSSSIDSLAYGFGDLWLVSSSTARLYRIDPRLRSTDHIDLGETAGRPVAELGDVWVGVSDNGGDTVLVDPRTLSVTERMGCCPGAAGSPGSVGAASVAAFDSVWTYNVGDGEVQRWNPPDLAHVIQVTDAPFYDGSCLTSIAATDDAVWVTLAKSIKYACNR